MANLDQIGIRYLVEEYVRRLGRAIVAFSGGVDSGLLAYVARQQLGRQNVIAVTGDSASVPSADRLFVRAFCQTHDISHHFIPTYEYENPSYRTNPENRCFFCKEELYRRLKEYAAQNGFHHVLDGTNTTDLKGHRPGFAALQRAEINAPYVELGINKGEIRAMAAHFHLEIADKPQSACLASRIPTGTPVDLGAMRKIDAAENFLKRLGMANPRVRFHGNLARLHLPQRDWPLCLERQSEIEAELKTLGFEHVTLDLKPYERDG